MNSDDLLIRPEKLEKLRKELELRVERRRRARLILAPPKKRGFWRRLFGRVF